MNYLKSKCSNTSLPKAPLYAAIFLFSSFVIPRNKESIAALRYAHNDTLNTKSISAIIGFKPQTLLLLGALTNRYSIWYRSVKANHPIIQLATGLSKLMH